MKGEGRNIKRGGRGEGRGEEGFRNVDRHAGRSGEVLKDVYGHGE